MDLLAGLGFGDVQTYIASGNVIFSAKEEEDPLVLEPRIEAHLESELGWPAPTFLRTLPQLSEVAEFESAEHQGADDSVYVTFLRAPATEAVRDAFADLESDMDSFRFSGRELYWLIHGKLSESPLFKKGISRHLGTSEQTARNMNTVRKLVATFDP